MTDSEQFKAAYDYLESLEKWVWHDFRVVPEPFCQKVYSLIDSNSITGKRVTWMENDPSDSWFIITVPGENNIQK